MGPGVLKSPIYPPTATDPICTFRSGTIQFYPITLATADIVFYKYPATPIYVAKLDTNDLLEYDSSNSTEFEWGVGEHMDLMDMILIEVDDFFKNKSQVEQINN